MRSYRVSSKPASTRPTFEEAAIAVELEAIEAWPNLVRLKMSAFGLGRLAYRGLIDLGRAWDVLLIAGIAAGGKQCVIQEALGYSFAAARRSIEAGAWVTK